jgi:hypothetical protein
MFSRTREVIKNKNKIEKTLRTRRKNELISLRTKSIFKAKLYNELKHIEVILQDYDIDAVLITVPDRNMAMFSTAIYSEDLAGYDIQQVEGQSNQFYIRRKYIAFYFCSFVYIYKRPF